MDTSGLFLEELKTLYDAAESTTLAGLTRGGAFCGGMAVLRDNTTPDCPFAQDSS